jgi:hypothetical protein
MEQLPPEEDRAWIHEHLRLLIQERGASPFLCAELLEPTARAFPEPFTGDIPSAKRLLRRLLCAASLTKVPFEVTAGDEDETVPVGNLHVHEAAAWFAGSEHGVLQFGISRETMQDGDGVVGVLGHEVAHAYRDQHGLVFFDAAEEELQTDLTTVFLGFGLLTTDLTDQYRRRRDGVLRVRGGYLSSGAMSYALAVQLAARDVPRAEVKRLARLLGPGQEAFLLEGYAAVSRERSTILPILYGSAPQTPRVRPNEGQPVFRIKGGWFRKPRCGGAGCDAVLSAEAIVCTACGGAIAGEARDREQALAAVEGAELAMASNLLKGTPLAGMKRAAKGSRKP